MSRMGLPTRETNSSHASSSQGPAHKPTTSLRDIDEYRVAPVGLDIDIQSSLAQSRARPITPCFIAWSPSVGDIAIALQKTTIEVREKPRGKGYPNLSEPWDLALQ